MSLCCRSVSATATKKPLMLVRAKMMLICKLSVPPSISFRSTGLRFGEALAQKSNQHLRLRKAILYD